MDATIASAITATSLALADAGIDMFDLVAAAAASFVEGDIMLDCTEQEHSAAQGSIILAYMPNLNQV